MAMWLWLGKKHGGNLGERKLYDLYIQTNAKGGKVLGYGTVHLARMGSVPTQRLYRPKGGMQNPYLLPETANMTMTNDDPMDADTWDGTSTQKGFALIRQDLLLQCGPICHRCKRQFPPFKLSAHHVKAQQDGGKDIRSNFELLCPKCHQETPSYGGKG